MKASLRRLAKIVLPVRVRQLLRAAFGWRWFEGDYTSWHEAAQRCTGYDSATILERVLDATVAVRDGRAAFERDGVVFAEAIPEPGLETALSMIAASCRGPVIRVVDFGGALGTTYWRHRGSLHALGRWHWHVVEQDRFVAAGNRALQNDELKFYPSIDAALKVGPADVLLASTVLQYLPQPHEFLAEVARMEFPWVLLNNLPLHTGRPDRLAIQRVPPEIYTASYPVWFFERGRLLAPLLEHYTVVHEFSSEAVWPVGLSRYSSTGLLLRHAAQAAVK